MKKELNLSDEIELWRLKFGVFASQSPKFENLNLIIKEAVKKLKEEIENPTYPYANVIQLIDKIFGEKLT